MSARLLGILAALLLICSSLYAHEQRATITQLQAELSWLRLLESESISDAAKAAHVERDSWQRTFEATAGELVECSSELEKLRESGH